MKVFSTLLLLFTLSGCSTLGALGSVASVASSEPMVGIETQVGDKTVNAGRTDNSKLDASDNEGTLTVTSTKADKQFTDVKEVTIKESDTYKELFLYMLGLLGWLLPSPSEIYREVKAWFTKKDKSDTV